MRVIGDVLKAQVKEHKSEAIGMSIVSVLGFMFVLALVVFCM